MGRRPAHRPPRQGGPEASNSWPASAPGENPPGTRAPAASRTAYRSGRGRASICPHWCFLRRRATAGPARAPPGAPSSCRFHRAEGGHRTRSRRSRPAATGDGLPPGRWTTGLASGQRSAGPIHSRGPKGPRASAARSAAPPGAYGLAVDTAGRPGTRRIYRRRSARSPSTRPSGQETRNVRGESGAGRSAGGRDHRVRHGTVTNRPPPGTSGPRPLVAHPEARGDRRGGTNPPGPDPRNIQTATS